VSDSPLPLLPPPPGSWAPARRVVRALRYPVDRFLAIEASSGVLLLLASAVALAWANSPWAASYLALWHVPVGLTVGSAGVVLPLHAWINDVGMAVFFFVAGLEIRREMHQGELSEPRRAALPFAAALGGMLVPALVYAAFNAGRPSAGGWGIPMATDIAFAVGVFALLGGRAPPALRVLLLSLAVIDDLGAIAVIALGYSGSLDPAGLAWALVGFAAIPALQAAGIRSPWPYLPAAALAWWGTYTSGVHAAIAGVALGLLTPVRAWLDADAVARAAAATAADLTAAPDAGAGLLPRLHGLERAVREGVSPAERLQHRLHGAVAFGVMPVFAFANAGVPLGAADVTGEGRWVFLGIFFGLLVGKPVGVLLAIAGASGLGVATRPTGVGWPALSVLGMAAGIGFTMALFVAQLAFPPGALLETAKLAILAASTAAGALSLAVGFAVLSPRAAPGAARSLVEAERATDR
jgi:NhaA family Na+:H+ antiporter